MNDRIKIALIAAATVIAAVAWYSYNSPYQTCVRAKAAQTMEADAAYQDSAAKAAMDAAADEPATGGLQYYMSPEPIDTSGSQPITEEEAERGAQIACASAG